MTTSPMQPGAQLCHVVHMGIEYDGEVVRALAWTDGLGAQLRGDTYFRVVFLESLPAVLPPPQALEDSRIGVCILGSEPGSSATQVNVEMRAIREAQARYLAGTVGTSATWREVESQLDDRVSAICGQAYQAGQGISSPALALDRAVVFGDGGAIQWAERLNGIPQLGAAVAEALPPLVEELYNTIAGCAANVTQENVQEFPRCREWGLRLTAQPPCKDVESLGSYIRQALGEQNRRLSTVLVERLLQGEQSEEIDRVIRVVQVSDLSGLAHVLNDELVQFIGDLLAIPGR